MKKLTWKSHKPLICLLLATVILLLFAVWTRPQPVLPPAGDWKLGLLDLHSEPEQYGNLMFLADSEDGDWSNTKKLTISPEQEAQIVQRLSQAVCRREFIGSTNWKFDPERRMFIHTDSQWEGLHTRFYFVSINSSPFVREIVLGASSYEHGSFQLPRLDGTWGIHPYSIPIEDGGQVTGDILRILGLE